MRSEFSYNFGAPGPEESPPRTRYGGYPFDLDGSERHIRPATGWTLWPDPATYPNGNGIGLVSAILRQFDAAVYQQMIARIPAGPLINAVPFNPMQYIGQVVFPQLPEIGDTGGVSR